MAAEANQTVTETKRTGEIDLVAIVREMWRQKFRVIKYGAIGLAVGIVVVIFTPRQYAASSAFVVQSIDASSSDANSLANLIGLTGALSGRGPTVLSPRLYPKVVSSSSFQKTLMYTTVDTRRSPVPVTLYDYMTQRKFQNFSLGKLIVSMFPERKQEVDSLAIIGAEHDLFALTRSETEVAKALASLVTVSLDEKNGYIKVTVRMPEALVAAQVATTTVDMLQRYITDFKLD